MEESIEDNTTSVIRFTKMHGAGNDYIYVDTKLYPIDDPSAAARAWSDRHKGIGSDGLVLIGRSPIPEADFTMRIFNADGSEAMMCGNASRCVGKYVYERGLIGLTPTSSIIGERNADGHQEGCQETRIRLLTLSGIKVLFLHIKDSKVEHVTVDMGEPVFENPRQYDTAQPLPSITDSEGINGLTECQAVLSDRSRTPLLRTGKVGGGSLFVCMGNPHYVIFTDNVDAVETLGRDFEYHPAFPERCNIEFAEMRPDGIRVRVWERGSGITMACGTGACATAVAACKMGHAGHKNRIIMDGGTLDIEWRETDNHVYMTGPAEFVFEGWILPPAPPL